MRTSARRVIDAAWAMVSLDPARVDYAKAYCEAAHELHRLLIAHDDEILREVDAASDMRPDDGAGRPRFGGADGKFDRNAYQREYMRRVRARKRAAT